MMEFLLTGILLDGSAVMDPRPLPALIISETLAIGLTAGVAVTLSTAISGAALVIFATTPRTGISAFAPAMGGISPDRPMFVFYLGVTRFRRTAKPIELSFASAELLQTKTFQKSLLANALWLFWFTVNGPIIILALNQNILCRAGLYKSDVEG